MSDQQQPAHDPMPLRGIVAFLRSCVRSGESLTAEDDAMIDRALEDAEWQDHELRSALHDAFVMFLGYRSAFKRADFEKMTARIRPLLSEDGEA